jgi:hypothetical protein
LGVDKNNITYSLNPIYLINNIIDISCGLYHNLILDDTGNGFTFGKNDVNNILINSSDN